MAEVADLMGPYVINAEHLTKKFGEQTVVDDLSLAIRKSEVFGFLGPNGAGKTTSIKISRSFIILRSSFSTSRRPASTPRRASSCGISFGPYETRRRAKQLC
jgi:ABC-type uncharacterized transport system ATPase subunit